MWTSIEITLGSYHATIFPSELLIAALVLALVVGTFLWVATRFQWSA